MRIKVIAPARRIFCQFSNFAKAPKGFQSSHMNWTAPGPTDSEEALVDVGTMLLEGGDDKGQDSAIHQEWYRSSSCFLNKYVPKICLKNFVPNLSKNPSQKNILSIFIIFFFSLQLCSQLWFPAAKYPIIHYSSSWSTRCWVRFFL